MLSACLLSTLGLVVLSLCKKRHRQVALPKYKKLPNSAVHGLLIVGFACLLASALAFVMVWGLALGSIYWLGWITATSMAQAMLLSFWPRWTLMVTAVLSVILSVSLWKSLPNLG